MIVKSSKRSSSRIAWAITVTILWTVTLATMFGPLAERQWEHPQLLFSLTTVAALACVFAATILIAIADRREMAEMGLLGTMLMAASVMPMVHGLVTPGVLFEETQAFATSSFLTLPIAVAVGAPLLLPHSAFGRWAARHWRDWTLLSVLGVFLVAGSVVFFPDAVQSPGPSSVATIVVSVALLLALGSLSARQLRFYELGRQSANLIASFSFALLAVMALAPMAATRYSAGFWWMQIAGALGVIGACGGLAVTKRMSPSAHDLLAPVLTRDPLVAFELGLSPIVHQFVADLEVKDELTRDHVIRTGELAMRVGERFRLSSVELRNLGLAAMLHDVGKVNVPDEILTKSTQLTDSEYELVKLHPADGEAMLRAEPTLAAAASIVRSHHERFDGGGYPDGLVGRDIPLPSRIIAACDAFDAMTHDRQYRKAMPLPMAFAILREHAGSQWDEAVIEQVIAAITSMPTVDSFDAVGRTDESVDFNQIPDDISELLVTLDAEI